MHHFEPGCFYTALGTNDLFLSFGYWIFGYRSCQTIALPFLNLHDLFLHDFRPSEKLIEKRNVALVPLATPMLARPGAITAVLVWQQRPDIPIRMPLLFIAIITACLSVYFVFYFAEWIRKMMGVGGIRVVTRLMGLLLAVIAVQFIVSGFQQIRWLMGMTK